MAELLYIHFSTFVSYLLPRNSKQHIWLLPIFYPHNKLVRMVELRGRKPNSMSSTELHGWVRTWIWGCLLLHQHTVTTTPHLLIVWGLVSILYTCKSMKILHTDNTTISLLLVLFQFCWVVTDWIYNVDFVQPTFNWLSWWSTECVIGQFRHPIVPAYSWHEHMESMTSE